MGGLLSAEARTAARIDGQTVVITGANCGIGLETAAELYSRGGRVVLACRDLHKAEDAIKEIRSRYLGEKGLGSLALLHLDLSSFKSVRKAAAEILDTYPRVDMLINNAGVMMCKRTLSAEGHELQLATNHLGHFLLTMLLLPRILRVAATRPADQPVRIINVSSIAHSYCFSMSFDDINMEHNYKPTTAYFRSKAANVLFTKALARRLKGRNVNVYSLHPGVIDTPLWRHLDAVVPGLQWLWSHFATPFVKTVRQGAQTTIHCALEPTLANQSGLYYSECKVKESSSFVREEKVQEELYAVSERLIGLDSKFDPYQPEDGPTILPPARGDTWRGFPQVTP